MRVLNHDTKISCPHGGSVTVPRFGHLTLGSAPVLTVEEIEAGTIACPDAKSPCLKLTVTAGRAQHLTLSNPADRKLTPILDTLQVVTNIGPCQVVPATGSLSVSPSAERPTAQPPGAAASLATDHAAPLPPVRGKSTAREADTGALSFELQDTAPQAATRTERVRLWLKQHAGQINAAAQAYAIHPAAIAGAIAWEALENVRGRSIRAVGVGKAHVTNSMINAVLQIGRGSGVAREAEDYFASDPVPTRRLKQCTISERRVALADPNTAIQYIGAIMGAYSREVAKAGYDISANPSILATYYNGAGVSLANIAAKLQERQKKTQVALVPGPTMGAWVKDHLSYLCLSLG